MFDQFIIWLNQNILTGNPQNVSAEKIRNAFIDFCSITENYITAASSGLYPKDLRPNSSLPEDTEHNVFLVTIPGTYENFGNVVLPQDSFGFIYRNSNSFTIQVINLPKYEIKNWTSSEMGLTYPSMRIYDTNLYQVISGKISSSINPKQDIENWIEISFTPSNGLAVEGSSSIEIDTLNDTLKISGTFVVVGQRKRIILAEGQTINLINSQPSVLYISENGTIGTFGTQDIGSIPKSALIFATYRKSTTTMYNINGLLNYKIDGIPNINLKKVEYGFLEGVGTRNFDLLNNKFSISSTNIILTTSGNRLVVTPQVQEIDLATSGSYIIFFDKDSKLNSIIQSNVGSLPNGSIIVATYTRSGSNAIRVSGLDSYNINSVPNDYINKGFGKIISYDGGINITGQSIEIKGTTILIIGRTRYTINSQQHNFSSTPSLFYFVPSTGLIGSTPTSAIILPADAIIFGGHIGSKKGREFEIWGLENNLINGYNSIFWGYKRVQKKLLVDFDPTQHYYKCDTTLSMTDIDTEPLIGSDPIIMKNRYEALMVEYPNLFTKEELVTIPTKFGDRTIDVFTFTPPTINTDPRPDAGVFSTERPHIFINCSIHGSEKTASMACYLFLKDILENWDTNKVLEWFRFNVKLSIVPTANPSGWANGTRGNSNLVDLNRNFPYQYISNYNPGQSTWSGLESLDQLESNALNTWVESNKNSLLLGIDFHNFFGEANSKANLGWTEGVTQFTCELGRIVSQRISRGSRESSPFLPKNYDEMLMTASYVTNSTGRFSGQMNNLLPYGLTFEVSQNFRYNTNFKPNDNDTLRLSTEVFGNSLATMTWLCLTDYNSKKVLFE